MAADINSMNLVCRLARDPELRAAGSTSVCQLRVAFNTSRKNQSGQWEDVGNFIDVSVWGAQGEALARNLTKGQRIGVEGRLEHRQWQDQNGNNREAISIVANRVQYLDPKAQGGNGGAPAAQRPAPAAAPAAAPMDDDCPF